MSFFDARERSPLPLLYPPKEDVTNRHTHTHTHTHYHTIFFPHYGDDNNNNNKEKSKTLPLIDQKESVVCRRRIRTGYDRIRTGEARIRIGFKAVFLRCLRRVV